MQELGIFGKEWFQKMNTKEKIPLERVDPYRWRIPQRYNAEMRVPGMVYADDELIEQILEDNALQQVANVSALALIVGLKQVVSEIHWSYVCEVDGIDDIYDAYAVNALGISEFDKNVVAIICGSSVFGHQVGDDYVKLAEYKQQDY